MFQTSNQYHGLNSNNPTLKLTGTAYGYARVSTQAQADEGQSLEIQENEIRKLANYRGYLLLKIFKDEGISGSESKFAKRVELQKLMDILKEGDCLIIYTISRLARSLRIFLDITKILETKKCALVIIREQIDTGNPYGNFTANLIALLSQLESDLGKDRQAVVKLGRIDKKQFVGKVPYGWRVSTEKDPVEGSARFLNGKKSEAVEVPEEQEIIRFIKSMYYDKTRIETYQSIANKLNDMGVKPPGISCRWHDNTIKRILKRATGPGTVQDPDFSKMIPKSNLNMNDIKPQTIEHKTEGSSAILQIGLNFFTSQ